MEVNVIKIGNSKGIRIPANILKQCGIDKKVIISVDDNKITLTPARLPRQGWAQACKRAQSKIIEDDPVIYDDAVDLEKLLENS